MSTYDKHRTGDPKNLREKAVGQVNREMVVLARESRGWTQKELASRVAVTQGLLSKYETGVIPVPESLLPRLVESLHYPSHFFSQPFIRSGLSVGFVFHRKRASLSARTLRRIEAQVNIQALGAEKLLKSVDIETENKFVPIDIADFDGDATQVAQLVRASWRLPMGPIGNLVELIEAAGGIVFRCDFESSKIDGLSYWLGTTPLFFLNSAAPNDRCRFSLAHELGHIIMHRIPSQNLEDEANAFAAEFLMPKDEIRGDLEGINLAKAAALKPIWKVSMAALLRRAEAIGRISKHQHKRFMIQMSGYRRNEPNPLPIEEPSAWRSILNLHQNDFGYSYADLANAICLDLDELQEKYFRTQAPMRLI